MTEEEVPSWGEIARKYGRFLYNVAYRLTGNDDDAQDLVQEVLLRVRKGLERYQPGSMEGWLSRIATNAFLDDVRRRKRRPLDLLPDEPENVIPPSRSADADFEASALSEGVQAALRDLPPDYRATVVLSDVVGFTYQEISDALDVPIGTVRSRLHRGRALLREALR
jgi:RNA polymerase sigma-70 factor (ECF subfamily)